MGSQVVVAKCGNQFANYCLNSRVTLKTKEQHMHAHTGALNYGKIKGAPIVIIVILIIIKD